MTLVVGCPIRDRLWILPQWFDYLGRAVKRAGFEHITVVFVGDSTTQLDSLVYATGECARRRWDFLNVPFEEQLLPYERQWNPDRYLHMVRVRNALLERVRGLAPDVFWSLDSDILTHEDSLAFALDAIRERHFDAVGLRCYMTPYDVMCPSYCMVNGGGLLRHDAEGTMEVDVIMATKVMTPAAYNVDYQTHIMGEDIGWSEAARAIGLHLGWDGRSVSKHVMGEQFLHRIDVRCGY